MYQEYRFTPATNPGWKLPMNFAVGLHLLVLATGLMLPQLFQHTPDFSELYTVDLVNLPEPVVEEIVVKRAASSPDKIIKKTVEHAPPPPPLKKVEAAPIEEIVPVAVEAAPVNVKPISIKPVRRKIKHKIVQKPQTNNRQAQIRRQKDRADARRFRQQLAQATQQEAMAQELAKQAALEADNEKQRLRQMQANNAGGTTAAATTPDKQETITASTSSNNTNPIKQRYYAKVINRLQQYWSLPDPETYPANTTAILIIRISKDGTITSKFFEKRSGKDMFDRRVEKTIQNASPMPAIPLALKKNTFEFGLRFTPGGIE